MTAFFIVVGSLAAYPFLNKAPTCNDGKQNGNETGIDCGGGCVLACVEQTDPVSILWSRTFEVVKGRFNAVAYLENHNPSKAVNKINYKFRFADANNLYIGKREGTTFIPPAGNFAIFEPAIDLGHAIPVYTTFEFTEEPVWLQVDEQKINQLKIAVSDIVLENPDTTPKLLATISNKSLFDIPQVNVVAIMYDESGNAVSVSQTYLEKLAGEESRLVTFTWPEPIAGNIVSKEIIPLFNIFGASIK